MIIGYGRTSTIEQVAGLEAQIRDLKAAGAESRPAFNESPTQLAPHQNSSVDLLRSSNTFCRRD
jgi:DNA invertase Pin-like site-specific DNA recombinase